MPKSIPEGLTQQHVLSALADLDAGVSPPFGTPTGYELLHDGKRYAPKAVIGQALQHLDNQTHGPHDFSGGQRPGQANYVLRELGFEVVEKVSIAMREEFVTSRGFALPADASEMAALPWFNMWQRRLWPYTELHEGETLFWYDTTLQAIVWKSRVQMVERFEYANKGEARERLQTVFNITDISDSYFDAAADYGYCIAYKIGSLVRLNVPKPADYKFPQGGWLRCSDEDAHEWLNSLRSVTSPDGPAADGLFKAATEVAESGYFDPFSLKDEREKKLREIIERRGQPEFRNKLIVAYGGCCAVTGCDAVAALEAAHIVPYTGPQSHHVTNGLLLRADIHTLFDLDLIGINPESLTISVATAIKATEYAELQGQKLFLPVDATEIPNHEALMQRWGRFGGESDL